MSDTCKHCGKEWTDHPGVEPTCAEVQLLKETLTVEQMLHADSGEEVERLTKRVDELTCHYAKDFAEDDTAIKALCTPFGIEDAYPSIPGDHGRFKSAAECVEELAGMLTASQDRERRLREALAQMIVVAKFEEWDMATTGRQIILAAGEQALADTAPEAELNQKGGEA